MGPEPQMLTVWNPVFQPETIEVHISKLLEGRPDKHVWWGKIHSRHQPESSKSEGKRLHHLVALAEASRERSRHSVLYSTNFQSLHALKVSEVVPGAPGEWPDDGLFPDYYQDKDIAVWFRVEDIRAISHDQTVTLAYLRTVLGNVLHPETRAPLRPFDPFTSVGFQYPVLIEGPSSEEVFDPGELEKRAPRVALYAELEDAVFSPWHRFARQRLSRVFEEDWPLFTARSKCFLLSAEVMGLQNQHEEAKTFLDYGGIVCEFAKAIEAELIDGIVVPLLQESSARRRLPPRELRSAMAHRRNSLDFHSDGRPTLRSVSRNLRYLRDAAGELGLPSLRALCATNAWSGWLEGFVDRRNRAVHNEQIGFDEYEGIRRILTASAADSMLLALVRARAELDGASM